MYVVNFLDRFYEGNDCYSLGLSKFNLDGFDASTTAVFTSKDGYYEFYLDGTVRVDGVIRYYELIEVDGNKTTFIIRIDGDEDITAVADAGNGSVTVL